ncbi:MAG: 2'-5' RNA ligase family protein [Novosphingobium sp.]|nr:2'-5' RNA ligase family protein [Novosphingobium sp.]
MSPAINRAPLIVTATLPGDVQAWADRLRKAHFPPERNHLAAHVTLFHALPPSLLGEARTLLARLAGDIGPVAARIDGVMDLGAGTAFAIHSPDMLDLRAQMAEAFHGMLSAQDRGVPRLHVTVQNKVLRAASIALQQDLAASFIPRAFAFAGLELHHYRGGPWEAAGHWSFRGKRKA